MSLVDYATAGAMARLEHHDRRAVDGARPAAVQRL